MPYSRACARWPASSGSKRMPPTTLGCSVLTSPPKSEGKPVISSTSCDGIPLAASISRVPLVAYIAQPRSTSAFASSGAPVLSESEKSAASGNGGLRPLVVFAQLRGNDRTDSRFAHRYAVKPIGEFHRLLVVGHDDHLRLARELAHHLRKALDVRVVQRG